jgi:hypothetical protein
VEDSLIELRAIALLRPIRVRQLLALTGKTEAEILAYFQAAGVRAREDSELRFGPRSGTRDGLLAEELCFDHAGTREP